MGLLQTAGIYWSKDKSHGQTLRSLHSVDFHENHGGLGQGFSLAKIHMNNLTSTY